MRIKWWQHKPSTYADLAMPPYLVPRPTGRLLNPTIGCFVSLSSPTVVGYVKLRFDQQYGESINEIFQRSPPCLGNRVVNSHRSHFQFCSGTDAAGQTMESWF